MERKRRRRVSPRGEGDEYTILCVCMHSMWLRAHLLQVALNEDLLGQ